jgi:hypothetical protein
MILFLTKELVVGFLLGCRSQVGDKDDPPLYVFFGLSMFPKPRKCE